MWPGDILNLKWEEVDIGQDAITFLVQKTRRILEVPLNNEGATVIRDSSRKSRETGKLDTW